ncbi:hypothetical protein CKO50_04115 [Pseudoalteromonas sp. HM-SA03]|uniref:hypothetical protein n=1 Tax=Pseudoalteromonas sp. HM-SA03 TaxID=2029678 RepID=UPI000BAE1138|nr:hypothetical protein [Pseudoalteromonas sp. HM-SA03]PAY02563.1 hypothetical protein CKO50_04115 [Pseudoalteromonas sp. HM-SA03]
MKFQNQLDQLKSGSLTRAQMAVLQENALRIFNKGDKDAKLILDAIPYSKPADTSILFMGFCPEADFSNRLDIFWKENGICHFDYLESEVQVNRWYEVCAGDLLILKKREQFGKTMKLYGFGRVTKICHDDEHVRYFEVNWADQSREIEVPLMGCNSTVDIKAMEMVEQEMPEAFWHWLNL